MQATSESQPGTKAPLSRLAGAVAPPHCGTEADQTVRCSGTVTGEYLAPLPAVLQQ